MRVRPRGWDVAALVGAFVVGVALTGVLFEARGPYGGYAWYGLDESDYLAVAADRGTFAHRLTNLHPLLSLLMFVPVQGVARLSGSFEVGVLVWVAGLGGLWVASTFAAGRLLGLGRGWSLVASGLVASSGAFFLFAPTLESWGGLTGSAVAVSLGLSGWAWRRGPGRGGLVHAAAVAVPLSVTTPLAVHGVVGAVVGRLGWRRVVQVAVNGFAAVALLHGVQAWFFPKAEQFIVPVKDGSEYFTLRPGRHWVLQPLESIASVFPGRPPRVDISQWVIENLRPAIVPDPASLGVLVVAGVALSGAVWVAWRSGDGRSGRDRGRLLVLSVGSMMAMTALHGLEPVLHVAAVASPLALLVVHVVAAQRRRWWWVGLAVVMVALIVWNVRVFSAAAALGHPASGA